MAVASQSAEGNRGRTRGGVRPTAAARAWVVWAGLLGLLAPLGAVRGQDAQTRNITEVAKGVRDAHQHLLRLKGGIAISYRLDVEQDPARPIFIFKQGLDGSLNIKWPVLRCRVEGPMTGFIVRKGGKDVVETRPIVREANYNFETHSGVGRDGQMLGQVANFRHAFSATFNFPLMMQYFVEADQHFVPGEEMKTEYWLPNALTQHPYQVSGQETIDGVPCMVLERAGLDTLWVATRHGHVVCKREYRFGVGKPVRERTLNSDLKEVTPGIWLPHRQVMDTFDERDASKPQMRLIVKVQGVRVGDLTGKDTEVILTKDLYKIEDHIEKRTYTPNPPGTDPFDASVDRALASTLPPPSRRFWPTFILGNIALGLAVSAYLLYRRHTGRATPPPVS